MSTPDQPYTDEIDLIELFSVLWSGKWWILGITGAALAGAFSWLTFTTPSYESEAVVAAPSRADYDEIYPGLLADESPEPDEVLREVMNYMASPNRQRDFLANRIESEQSQEKALDRAVERLKINSNQENELQGSSITIRYTAQDPDQARTLVEAFIDKSNKQVADRLARNAKSRITQAVSSISGHIETRTRAYKGNIEQQLALLKAAKEQAQAHGIKTNEHNKASSLLISNQFQASAPDGDKEGPEGVTMGSATSILQEPLFEYGTRALSALIDNRQRQLKQLSPETIQLRARQQSWNNLKIKTANASVLSVYQSASDAEPTRSGVLVMALAGMLGLLLGVVVLLGRNAWKNAAYRHVPGRA